MIDGDQEKRAIWAKLLQRRGEMGYPYIFFSDTVNNNTVDVYKDKNLKIYASNLCSEIMLPANEDWSFVCCLSSINLAHYDEWKDTDAVQTLRDSDLRDYQLALDFMKKAYAFAKANRAIGL